jgi:hypothetical protein
MVATKKTPSNTLVEQTVRNEDIFCSLLFDEKSSTLRVVDFRGGNLQQKQAYLEKVQAAESIRKIFTLIERDDIHGWQRAGYLREGVIPGYYKRSDAYIMGNIVERGWESSMASEDSEERKDYLNEIRDLAKEYAEIKTTGLKGENVTEEETPEMLRREYERRRALAATAPKAKATKGGKTAKPAAAPAPPDFNAFPILMQFSREVEYYHYCCSNKRTGQLNILSAEYQDCFGNAKVSVYFDDLKNKTDLAIAKQGLISFVDWLQEIGAVAIFALVNSDNKEMNALYASVGFKSSGWLNRHLCEDGVVKDQILWTQKLLPDDRADPAPGPAFRAGPRRYF